MAKPRKATEADFTTFVLDLARVYGWRSAHFRPARTDKGYRTAVQGDGAGFPDLTLVRPPRLVFAELKSETGRLRPEQVDWLEDLRGCSEPFGDGGPVEVYVWRPDDVPEIQAALR